MKKVYFLFFVMFSLIGILIGLKAYNEVQFLQKRTIVCLSSPDDFRTNGDLYGIDNDLPSGHSYISYAGDSGGCLEWMASKLPFTVYLVSKALSQNDFMPYDFPGYLDNNEVWDEDFRISVRDRFSIQNGRVVEDSYTYKKSIFFTEDVRIIYQFSESGKLEKVHNCVSEKRSDGYVGYLCDTYDPHEPGRFEGLWSVDQHFVPEFEVIK